MPTEPGLDHVGAGRVPFRKGALVAVVAGGGTLNVFLALFPGALLALGFVASLSASLAGFLAVSLMDRGADYGGFRASAPRWSGRYVRWWAGALMLYAVLLGRIWLDVQTGSVDLIIWTVGMMLFVLPFVRQAGPLARCDRMTLRRDVPLVLGLVALTIVLHVHDLREWRYAVVGDEMLFFERALETVRHGIWEPFILKGVYYNSPMLNSVYQGLFVWLAPDDGWGWKFSSVFSVALTVPPMYMLGRRFGGAPMGTFAAVAGALGHYILAFTHIGYTHLDALPIVAWGMLVFSTALRSRSQLLMLMSGFLMGFSLYTALPARALVVVAAVWVAFSVRSWRDIRAFWPLVLGFAACAAPFAAENGLEAVRVMGRDTMSPYSVYASEIGDPVSRFMSNFDNLLVWWYNPDRITHYTSGPLLDHATGVLAIVGLAAALYFWRPMHRIVLLWLAVALVPTALLSPYPQTPVTRMHGAVLPLALLSAMGLGFLLVRFRASGLVRWAVVIALIVVVAGLNQWRFQYATFNMTERHMPESLAIGAWESEMCGTGPDTLFVGRDGDLLEKVLGSYGSVRSLPAVVGYGDARIFGGAPGCRIFFRPDDAKARDVLGRLDGHVVRFENPSGGSWVAVVSAGSRVDRRGGGNEIY